MKTTPIQSDELRNHHIFAGLNEEQLAKVIASAYVIELEDNEHLFEAGQQAKDFFLVRNGRVKLYLTSADGAEKVIHFVHAGETFAEAIMFMDSAIYPINASAITRSQILAFPNKVFREILSESVDTCFRLMADMSTWLKKQLNEIDALTLQNATLRFSNYLLQQIPADQDTTATVTLEAAKNVIASRLSIQPESLSRIMRNMQREGLIETHGNEIVINDVNLLRSQDYIFNNK
jgi:CRP-like cAMP-binding protein